ncbi:non-specific phospholipase C6 [Striga asiatica]|uniref:Non-specific phospholipase C6 n=1 Tax=Striga asiatica TaxID=4170 RepID=A0A5A7R2A2_STRAF|nr:non-specific phospholipase C6 [Striga asiatica]
MRSLFFNFLIIFFSNVLPQSLQQQPPHPIKTIVVLVLENRSFDHMLGWTKNSINPTIDGLNGKECNLISTTDPSGPKIYVSDDSEYIDLNSGHTFEDIHKQVFGSDPYPSMSDFVEQASTVSKNLSETVMKGFHPEKVPVFSRLANEFTVFNRWFSSVPGTTQPNWIFLFSATSQGSTSNVKRFPAAYLCWNLCKLKYAFKFKRYESKFERDAKCGKLPSLTVIEPRYFDVMGQPANDDHLSHDVAQGQRLVKEVYETLRGGPAVERDFCWWSRTTSTTGFTIMSRRLTWESRIQTGTWGPRLINRPPSPNSEYEHSSIPATIKKVFNLSSHFLTHRDSWAGTFEHVFSELTSPRTNFPEVLPDVAHLRKEEANENRGLSEFQDELVQLAAVLKGDHYLSSFPNEMVKKMKVREANEYVKGAVPRFIRASKEAKKLGADPSAIVDMRSSLTTQTSSSVHK